MKNINDNHKSNYSDHYHYDNYYHYHYTYNYHYDKVEKNKIKSGSCLLH